MELDIMMTSAALLQPIQNQLNSITAKANCLSKDKSNQYITKYANIFMNIARFANNKARQLDPTYAINFDDQERAIKSYINKNKSRRHTLKNMRGGMNQYRTPVTTSAIVARRTPKRSPALSSVLQTLVPRGVGIHSIDRQLVPYLTPDPHASADEALFLAPQDHGLRIMARVARICIERGKTATAMIISIQLGSIVSQRNMASRTNIVLSLHHQIMLSLITGCPLGYVLGNSIARLAAGTVSGGTGIALGLAANAGEGLISLAGKGVGAASNAVSTAKAGIQDSLSVAANLFGGFMGKIMGESSIPLATPSIMPSATPSAMPSATPSAMPSVTPTSNQSYTSYFTRSMQSRIYNATTTETAQAWSHICMIAMFAAIFLLIWMNNRANGPERIRLQRDLDAHTGKVLRDLMGREDLQSALLEEMAAAAPDIALLQGVNAEVADSELDDILAAFGPGLTRGSSNENIRSAFRARSLANHPNKPGGNATRFTAMSANHDRIQRAVTARRNRVRAASGII
jgi:hypothetical protein